MKPLYEQKPSKWHEYKPDYTPVKNVPQAESNAAFSFGLAVALMIGAIVALVMLLS